MDESDLNRTIESLVADLAENSPDHAWSSVTHLLHFGEEGEAGDVLVATLVRDNVPITRSQHERLRVIVDAFDLDAPARDVYRYLGDPEMLDRMTVVDEPSS